MSLPIPVTFHHVGITVSNLERAVEWYSLVFGLKPGVALEVSGPSGERVLRLPPHVHRAVLLPVGDFAIELLEFVPTRKPMEMRQDDVGYVYICFAVEDLEDVYQRLTAAGIDFHTEPLYAEEGQIAGSKFCVMRDPDGKTIELVELGPGMHVPELHKAAAAGVDLSDPLIMDG
jgi:catechol 2,3-dioxygenase-like lactoylglutathione lyase family enzyme